MDRRKEIIDVVEELDQREESSFSIEWQPHGQSQHAVLERGGEHFELTLAPSDSDAANDCRIAAPVFLRHPGPDASYDYDRILTECGQFSEEGLSWSEAHHTITPRRHVSVQSMTAEQLNGVLQALSNERSKISGFLRDRDLLQEPESG